MTPGACLRSFRWAPPYRPSCIRDLSRLPLVLDRTALLFLLVRFHRSTPSGFLWRAEGYHARSSEKSLEFLGDSLPLPPIPASRSRVALPVGGDVRIPVGLFWIECWPPGNSECERDRRCIPKITTATNIEITNTTFRRRVSWSVCGKTGT